ncbi:arsenical resistance operon trans-acting repressor ArsD [Halalkalibacter wakoensis JCM 9140]|uniref:Arsenical resistance operon trans-acting repressor ArsD n=1 Tax=Halalkalibacter wakoensis JCM 9140 TaxID=1236970 RepID=W4Q6U9_9BACI|nr:arsenite efflux transporter metallochaperone ArsD [Halalkalibacter wakoensis]GAE27695.1 arsenical resistance operon trans-acting repressor ArsD [Halalkalibacter wakoensis JCM 9140]
MSKIRIYDPAMCCATGVCGPSVDPELTRVATAIFLLEKKNIDIVRFNLGSEPQAFIDEANVQELLNTKGTDALPAVIVDGEVKLAGRYPTNEEFADWADVPVRELTKTENKSKGIELL